MSIRWLHRSWVYFWTALGTLIAGIIIVGGITYGILQLPATKNYVTNFIEKSFNNDGLAVLEIGKLKGHLPFKFQFTDISIFTDSTKSEIILHLDTTIVHLDVRGLLSNKLILQSVEFKKPNIFLDLQKDYSALFTNSKTDFNKPIEESNQIPFGIDYLLPRVSIQKGKLTVENLNLIDSLFINTNTLTLSDIRMESFLEYGSYQRFIDVEQLSFGIPEANIERINFFGQLFNDQRHLELNAVNISTEHNKLRFSAEFDGVNLLKENILSQLNASTFDVSIDELITLPDNLRKVIVGFPHIKQDIYSKLKVQGTIDSITVNDFYLGIGNSQLEAFGGFRIPKDNKNELFQINIQSLYLDSLDVQSWTPALNSIQKRTLSQSEIFGSIQGNFQNINSNIQILNKRGDTQIISNLDINNILSINGRVLVDQLDVGKLVYTGIENTNLNGSVEFESNLLNTNSGEGKINIRLDNGSLNAFDFDSLSFTTQWKDGDYNTSYILSSGHTFLNGEGLIELGDSLKALHINGQAEKIDLKSLTNSNQLSSSLINLDYELNLNGTNIENAVGLLTIDLPNTIVEGDTLKPHQIYADFSSEYESGKTFRLTSTPLDVSLSGDFNLSNIIEVTQFWIENISQKFNKEILLQNNDIIASSFKDSIDTSIELDFNIKELSLLRSYFSKVPEFKSNSTGKLNLNFNDESILFNLALFDSSFSYNAINADSLNVQVTGSFRKNDPISSFSTLQILASTSNFSSDVIESGNSILSLQLDDDSLYITNTTLSIVGDNDFFIDGNIHIADSMLNMNIDSISLGNNNYKWQSVGTPKLTYYADKRLEFENFKFKNEQESLSFEGILSSQYSDSVNYNINNVDLDRISNLINGRIDFSGILDANFTTKSLTRIPSIQGELGINKFSIDDRVIGDVALSSLFNSNLNRFDTKVIVSTDSTKYPDYFSRTDRRGQNITLEGFVQSPNSSGFSKSDSLYYFDLNFESTDLWVIPFIAPNLFTEMSGVATGSGSILGGWDDYDFTINYDIGLDDAVYFRPKFLDTYCYGVGNIIFNREDGLIFNDVFVTDPSGGTAILNGKYDLGGFGKIHDIDLSLEMDEFQFLNNVFDPNVPFFGEAYGSTTLRMSGTNRDPILTTETPLIISDFSNIAIPLLEETKFDGNNKFIRFVDSFEFESNILQGTNTSNKVVNNSDDSNSSNPTFVERFTLDLQFVAENTMGVQLIFDPVTGDQIEANGIGRLGIRLQDEELSMYGQFDINSGTYQFVSGEIFTRRFDIESGGTIIWDGEPANARLDLNAIYAARPDINTLSKSRVDIDSESSKRVPVELVLNVSGSIFSIENNFFFRLPNNFETRQNSTLNTQISSLNRNEDEKLIQAASFLLMGDFIPSSIASTDAPDGLTTNFSGSSAVLNPLLSNQIISPLLSNQINSLLRSDIGNLDIDFNLNTYNDVDLGVALRLYNDKIILSREGQITGAQSNIGDLDATYRINNTLSVMAFHRQDRTFSNLNGAENSQQAQDINGVGFESEVSFNTWKELLNKISRPFKKLFGNKKDTPEIATSK